MTARARICISAAHTRADLEYALEARFSFLQPLTAARPKVEGLTCIWPVGKLLNGTWMFWRASAASLWRASAASLWVP